MLHQDLLQVDAIYTGYYKVMNETDVDQASFTTQLKNNNSQAVYLSLNIPLFNNYTTGRNIKLARIKRDDTAFVWNWRKIICILKLKMPALTLTGEKMNFTAAIQILSSIKNHLVQWRKNLNPDWLM